MGVYDERRAIHAQLQRELGSDFVAVSAPDHPLLLRGPDLLVGGRGGLTAIFCVTTKERARPSLATARIALCRLALPPHARLVLVVEDEDWRVVRANGSNVAAVISLENRGALAEISDLAENPRKLDPPKLPATIRSQVYDRFSATYRISRVSRRRGAQVNFEARLERAPLSVRSERMRKIHGRPDEFASLALSGAGRSFLLDNGVPYPTGEPSWAVIADQVPTRPGDPDKYARAIAFSGWALLADEDSSSLDYLLSALYRRTSFQ